MRAYNKYRKRLSEQKFKVIGKDLIIYMTQYDDDVILINCQDPLKKKKKILDDLDSLDRQPDTLPPSFMMNFIQKKDKPNKKHKDDKKSDNNDSTDDASEPESSADIDWIASITSVSKTKFKGKKKFKGFMENLEFDEDGNPIRKNKKDKKNKNGIIAYDKQFEVEGAALRNMYVEQSKFCDSLQKKYDAMNSTKSVARGIGKFTTDLINALSSARATQLSILKEQINTKKLVSDLNFKERKEFSVKTTGDDDNTAYASTFMRELIGTGRNNVVSSDYQNTNDSQQYSDSYDNLADALAESIGDTGEPYQRAKTIEYENRVTVYVCCKDNGEWFFSARDEEGNEIPDYPVPVKTKMTFNRDMMRATDQYGRKFELEIID